MYSHWQPGTLIRAVCGVVLGLLLLTVLPVLRGVDVVTLVVTGASAAVLLVVLTAFHGLGTEVTADAVKVWFGYGWIRRTIATHEISDVREVRNAWWMGWGIRLIGRGATLWNVSGLDAVELQLRSGRRFRIGTDDPVGLAAAIRQASGSSVGVSSVPRHEPEHGRIGRKR